MANCWLAPPWRKRTWWLVRDAEQLAHERDGLVVDRLVLLAAVAVLDDRHARALEVEELVPRALERGEGEPGGTGIEVVNARHVDATSRGQEGAQPTRLGAERWQAFAPKTRWRQPVRGFLSAWNSGGAVGRWPDPSLEPMRRAALGGYQLHLDDVLMLTGCPWKVAGAYLQVVKAFSTASFMWGSPFTIRQRSRAPSAVMTHLMSILPSSCAAMASLV